MPTRARASVDFPVALGPITAIASPGSSRNEMPFKIGWVAPGAGDENVARNHRTARSRQLQSVLASLFLRETGAAPSDRAEQPANRSPLRNDLLDGGQRSCGNDRGRNHRAGRCGIPQGEPRARAQQQRLQQQARHADDRGDGGCTIGRIALSGLRADMLIEPLNAKRTAHPQGVNGLCTARAGRSQLVATGRCFGGGRQRLAGEKLIEDGQHDEHGSTAQCDDAEQGMKQKDKGEVERRVGEVQNSLAARGRQETGGFAVSLGGDGFVARGRNGSTLIAAASI